MTLINEVKLQYEKYPYPRPKLFATVSKQSALHASFETGSRLCHGKIEPHDKKRILLFGCGTQEPAVFQNLHPKAQITAVDISEASLKIAKRRLHWFKRNQIKFVNENILDFAKDEHSSFDYIHCYGVLHHLPNPLEGLKALHDLLAPNGFARLMLYSKASRRRIQVLQNAARLLKIKTPHDLKKFIQSLPPTHELRLTYELHLENGSEEGVVDAFLHACENPFSHADLKQALEAIGLYLHAWDFSSNTYSLLKDAWGETLTEKIRWLEATDQWPSNFIFWISKEKPQLKHETYLVR